MEVAFNEKISELLNTKGINSALMSKQAYMETIELVKFAKMKRSGKTPNDYHRLKRYDIITINGEERLVSPGLDGSHTIKYYLHTDELFRAIHEVHLLVGHCGRDKMKTELNSRYKNVTKETIMIYLKLCRDCQRKNSNNEPELVKNEFMFF